LGRKYELGDIRGRHGYKSNIEEQGVVPSVTDIVVKG
jgi:hypothetical protein